MPIAKARGEFAIGQIVGAGIDQPCDLRVEQRDVDVLTFTRGVAVLQRRQNADAGIHARHHIRDAHTDFHRLARRHAGETHDAAHALNEKVISRSAGVGAGMAKPRDGAVDQPWIALTQLFVRQTIFGEPAGLVVLHQNVGLGQQLVNQRVAFIASNIDGNGALVAIGRKVVRTFVGGVALAVLDIGRAPLAGVVAFVGTFHLDHIRSQIAQQLRGARASENARKIQYPDSLECSLVIVRRHVCVFLEISRARLAGRYMHF